MKVFFRIDYPKEGSDPKNESVGIFTANRKLLENTIRFSRVVDEFGFVSVEPGEEEALKSEFPEKKVRGHDFRLGGELQKVFQYYDIFFVAGYGLLDILKCSALFSKNLSIFGLTHSLNSPEILSSIRKASDCCSENDSVICTSTTAKEVVKKALSHKKNNLALEVIPFGVDVERYRPLREQTVKNELRIKHGLPPDDIIFLSLGRLCPYTKMELAPLFKAFSDMKKTLDSERRVFLLVVGREHGTGYVDVLNSLVLKFNMQDRCKIISSYDSSEIPSFYNVSDVFVSPSDNTQETFGLTILEAMASGLPVIASDWNGYKYTILEGITGFRVPTYWADLGFTWNQPLHLSQSVSLDIEKLGSYMKLLAEDQDLRTKMGKAARNFVEERFSWKVVIDKYDQLFQKFGTSKKGPRNDTPPTFLENSVTPVEPAKIFSSYPTSFVKDISNIRMCSKDFVAYPNVFQLIDKNIADRICTRLGDSEMSVKEVSGYLYDIYKTPVKDTFFHIMVLMKYGVLSHAA